MKNSQQLFYWKPIVADKYRMKKYGFTHTHNIREFTSKEYKRTNGIRQYRINVTRDKSRESAGTENTPKPDITAKVHPRFPLLGLTREDTIYRNKKNSPRQFPGRSPKRPGAHQSWKNVAKSPSRESNRVIKSDVRKNKPLKNPQNDSENVVKRQNTEIVRTTDLSNTIPRASRRSQRSGTTGNSSLFPEINRNKRQIRDTSTSKSSSNSTDALSGCRITLSTKREKTIFPSRYGYHERSNSPTYQRLSKAREALETHLENQLKFVSSRFLSETHLNRKTNFSDFYHRLLWTEKPIGQDTPSNTVANLVLGKGVHIPVEPLNLMFNVDPKSYLTHLEPDVDTGFSTTGSSWSYMEKRRLSVTLPNVSFSTPYDGRSTVGERTESSSVVRL